MMMNCGTASFVNLQQCLTELIFIHYRIDNSRKPKVFMKMPQSNYSWCNISLVNCTIMSVELHIATIGMVYIDLA